MSDLLKFIEFNMKPYIKSIKLCINHASKVKRYKQFNFSDGLNFIIGPNGYGKTTLLSALSGCSNCNIDNHDTANVYFVSTERINPNLGDGSSQGIIEMILKIRAKFSSHGQITKLSLLNQIPKKANCLLIDEPETAQDDDNIILLRNGFIELAKKIQIVIATHEPILYYGTDANIIELRKNYMEHSITKRKNIF